MVSSDRNAPGGPERYGPRIEEADGKSQGRLVRYISAGGMKQTRRTLSDDIREARQRFFMFMLAFLLLIWLLFYFVPFLDS